MEKLRWLVQHAYQNVLYYRNLFDAHGIRPAEIQDFADFRRIPLLSKETIRRQAGALVATNFYPQQLIRLTTGGSTGEPLAFFRTRGAYPQTLAFEWRNYNWNGYHFGDKIAVLRGHSVEPDWFEYQRNRNALVLSSYKMTRANLPKYRAALDQFRPKYILAYPSAIELLAQFIRYGNPPGFLAQLRGIFTSSETLYSEQKILIENTFGVPVFDKYGNSEMVTMIGTCEKGNYHDFMEYSYTEILDENGNEVIGENLSGEIISTGFVNPALPLLRYQTGDRVRVTRRPCPCGRDLTVVQALEGRVKEVIVARDGSQLPLAPILFGIHDPNWDQVRRIQFVQAHPGELQILAETANPNPAEVSEYLTRIFSGRLAGQFNFRVQIVDEISLTPRGKFQYLIRKNDA